MVMNPKVGVSLGFVTRQIGPSRLGLLGWGVRAGPPRLGLPGWVFIRLGRCVELIGEILTKPFGKPEPDDDCSGLTQAQRAGTRNASIGNPSEFHSNFSLEFSGVVIGFPLDFHWISIGLLLDFYSVVCLGFLLDSH